MQASRNVSLIAALALGAFPCIVPAGEAPATSAASQQEAERRLATAQQELDAAARRVAELSAQLGRRFNMQLNTRPGEGPPPRALLGVGIGPGADKDGAHVMDVSPGGPAAEAGIKVGDVITGIGDLDLTKDSNPGRALVEKMNQLAPGLKVKVAVLRDGKKLSFDVTPRPAPQEFNVRRQDMQDGGRGPGNPGGPDGRGGRGPGQGPQLDVPQLGQLFRPGQPGRNGPNAPNGPGVPNGPGGPNGPAGPGGREGGPQPFDRAERMDRGVEIQLFGDGNMRFNPGEADTRFGGAEMATLSERLGSYFGVKAGVLVVRAGVDSQFKLQDGDVLLAVDGREITSAQQAGRILRSYQPGEKLTLKVQRDRKVQSLEITAPGGRRPN